MTDSARKQAIPNERPSCADVKIRVAINDEINYKVDFDNNSDGAKSLTFGFNVIDVTPLELFELVKQGCNVTSVCINAFGKFHRKKDHFKEAQVIFVDFDNDKDVTILDGNGQVVKDDKGRIQITRVRCDDEDYITFDDLLNDPFVRRFGLFIYTTPSHTEGHHKLRVVFLLPEKVTDKEEFERLLRLFIWKFKSDPSCKDAGRFFYGMGKGGNYRFLGNTLTDEAIKGLSEEFENSHPKIDRAESIKKIVAYANPRKGADLRRFYVECARRRGDEIISQSVGPSIGAGGKKVSGNRHNARARVAYWFGGLVAGCVMEEFEALGFLEQSISGNTDNFSKAMRNAKECFYAGMSKPITLDDLERERRARKVDSCTYYPYVDDSGKLLYETFKNTKGDFRYRRFDDQGREARTLYSGWFDDDNGFLKKIKGANDKTRVPHSNAVWIDACPRVLYRADKLAKLRAGDLVVIATNEIQAHKFEAFGLVATTAGNVEGDGWIDEFGSQFRGLDVVVCAGKQNITIASSCRKGSAKRVRIFRPEVGYKPTRQELLKAIDELPDYGEIRLNSRIKYSDKFRVSYD